MTNRILSAAVFLCLIFGAKSARAQIFVDHFSGLNDTDSSATLDDSEAQSALNIESSISGTALQKRKGFVRTATLTVATGPISGSYSFIDPNGNQQDIVCHDHYCSKSTNGAAFSSFLSTAGPTTIPVRWSFVDINGIIYGANDQRDPIFKYDGTTLSYPATMPKGSVLELTKDRLVVADVATNLNGVYYSQKGTYTNFTTGGNAIDPYIDSMGSSGDRVTALKYSLGRLYIFKPTSINACIVIDQYVSSCYPISNSVGSSDPASIVEIPGAIAFRGGDRNYWQLDHNGLTLLSKKITSFVKSQNSGSTQSNTQTSQTDWQNGTQFPITTWNTVSVAGSIFPSSGSVAYTTTATFNTGAYTYMRSLLIQNSIGFGGITSTYTITTYGASVLPENDTPAWSNSQVSASVSASTLTFYPQAQADSIYALDFTANAAANHVVVFRAMGGGNQSYCRWNFLNKTTLSSYGHIDLDFVNNDVEYIGSGILNNTTPLLATEASSVQTSFSTYTVIIDTDSGIAFWRNGVFISSQPFGVAFSSTTEPFNRIQMKTRGGPGFALFCYLKFLYASDVVANPNSANNIPATASYLSPIVDTSYSTPVAGPFTSTVTIPAGTSIVYKLRTSTSPNNDLWSAYETIYSSGRPQVYTNRYWQYQTTLAHLNYVDAPGISGINLTYATTGQFETQCIQPGTGITGWGILNCSNQTSGNGSIALWSTSAATCATLPVSMPNSWQTAATNNATLTISTNAAMYIGAVSTLGSSSDTAQIDICTIFWNNGVTAPPVWGTFDALKNSIYWTMAINNSATNNRILKYDLNLDPIKSSPWFPFDIQANAIRNIRNVIYFGNSTGGYWNTYGSVDADSGTAINAFWISKDFSAGSPFVEKNFNSISLIAKNQVTGNMSVIYTMSNNVATTYTVSLSTTAGQTYVRANRALLKTSPYQFMNVNLGNNSVGYFEISGLGIETALWPWKPFNP